MEVPVLLPKVFNHPFTYLDNFQNNRNLKQGDIVIVPFGNKKEIGVIWDTLKNSGVISSYFLIYYSIFRFFIEFTREPDAQIGLLNYFSVGQIISVISLVLGVTIFFFKYEKN